LVDVARNSALTALRWIAFIPAAFVASVIASFLGTLAGGRFSEFIGFTTSGAFAAFAFVIAGLTVAPVQSKTVKWVLIALSASLGAISAFGSWLGEDKLKVATGLSMLFFSFAIGTMPLTETSRPARTGQLGESERDDGTSESSDWK
jgi:hypothetical protein